MPNMRIPARAALTTLLLATLCLAQATRPTTRGADDTAPRQALIDLNAAMRDGDVGRIRSLFLVTSADEARDAWRSRILQAATSQPAPTTQGSKEKPGKSL